MSDNKNLELISFKICPFVQRSVIALNEKQVDYQLTHIELNDTPEWFDNLSPLGKVPVLLVGDKPVFESAVIMEYLDETYPPSLHPEDALEKAQHRSWVEFCSDLLGTQYRLCIAGSEQKFNDALEKTKQGLQRVDKNLPEQTPFFAGEPFSLIDTAFAPLFMRMAILSKAFAIDFELSERLQTWSDALLAKPSVQHSVVDDFEAVFMTFLKKEAGYLVNNL